MTEAVAKAAQTALIEELLQGRFDPQDHKTNQQGLTYVEDEKVMDRLDLVLGVGNWDVPNAVAIDARNVAVTLRIRNPETGEWASYSDFGTATNAQGETLKEAWTDAFRRVARIPGVARYVYAGEVGGTVTPFPVQLAQPVQQPVQTQTVQTQPVQQQPQAAADPGVCPVHLKPWRDGKYGPYCTSKAQPGQAANDRGYCPLTPAKLGQ